MYRPWLDVSSSPSHRLDDAFYKDNCNGGSKSLIMMIEPCMSGGEMCMVRHPMCASHAFFFLNDFSSSRTRDKRPHVTRSGKQRAFGKFASVWLP